MSGQWAGGKGDKSRITDHKLYCDNYDAIFRKNPKVEEEPFRALFLDDVREPNEATLWGEKPPTNLIIRSNIRENKWDIVRTYDEFVEYIEKNGIPTVVSFDNDLWDVSSEMAVNPDNEMLVKQFQMDGWQEFTIKTGAHCAEYLVKACKARNKPLPKYYIHSANSKGREIIREILENGKE